MEGKPSELTDLWTYSLNGMEYLIPVREREIRDLQEKLKENMSDLRRVDYERLLTIMKRDFEKLINHFEYRKEIYEDALTGEMEERFENYGRD